jgi:hypothetical protein
MVVWASAKRRKLCKYKIYVINTCESTKSADWFFHFNEGASAYVERRELCEYIIYIINLRLSAVRFFNSLGRYRRILCAG